MTSLETIGGFVARGIRGRVPQATRTAARLHLIDTVGAWVAGSHTSEGRALIAFRAASAGDGALDVATPCALARLSEVDNVHLASTTTPGGIVIPAALTIAASRPGTDGTALLEAVVAGIEAMVRLGVAIGGPGVLYRGIWPTYVAAPFGVAAVAARLHDLDAVETAHALALALTLAAPGVGHHNAATTSRWFAIGQAAQKGLTAARAAQAGFTSDLGLLNGRFLRGVYGIDPEVSAFAVEPGMSLALDETSFKPWCAARQTMAATQALIEIMDAGARPDAMSSIEVHVPPPFLGMIDHGVISGDRASHLTSVSYRLALAACDSDALFDVGHSPPAVAGRVRAFMQKVSVKADEALLAHYPKAWPARVVAHTAGGTHERLMLNVPGDPQRPFAEPQITNKFRRVTASLGGNTTESLLMRCHSIFEGGRPLTELTSEIAKTTAYQGSLKS
jgi:2-methylcitrate dehydratase PrpD